MSHWYEPKKEDIEIDGEDIDILLDQDKNGCIYVSIKKSEILELLDNDIQEIVDDAIWNYTHQI